MTSVFQSSCSMLVLLLSSVESLSTLTVISPSDLQFDNGISTINETAQATFGLPVYRGGLTAPIVYATQQDRFACDPLDQDLLQEEYNKVKIEVPNKPSHPMIIAVDRGQCSFVSKVLNAQEAGANAVLVFDNESEREEEVIMVSMSERSGESVKIPSMMISKKYGDKIRRALLDETTKRVVVTMRWLEINKSETVTFDLWTNSGDQALIDLLIGQENVNSYTEGNFPFANLKNTLNFRPRYEIIDGYQMGCSENDQSEDGDNIDPMDAALDEMMQEACGTSCINGGRYCATTTGLNTVRGIIYVSGRKIMKMNLFQLCIREISRKTFNEDKVITAWWKVNRYFYAYCVYANADFSQNCALYALEKKSPSKEFSEAVSQCIDDNLHGGKSKLLQREIPYEQSPVAITDTSLPSNAYINKTPYLGSLLCGVHEPRCSIFEAICAAYAPNSVPEICHQPEKCELTKPRDICGVCGGDGSSCQWTLLQLVKWTGTSLLIIAVFVVIYSQNRHLSSNIQRIEALYEPLLEFAPKKPLGMTDTTTENVDLNMVSLFDEEQNSVEKVPLSKEKEQIIGAHTMGIQVVTQEFVEDN